MIGFVLTIKLTVAVIAASILGFVLALYIGVRVMAFRGAYASIADMDVGANLFRVRRRIPSVTFSILFTIGSGISLLAYIANRRQISSLPFENFLPVSLVELPIGFSDLFAIGGIKLARTLFELFRISGSICLVSLAFLCGIGLVVSSLVFGYFLFVGLVIRFVPSRYLFLVCLTVLSAIFRHTYFALGTKAVAPFSIARKMLCRGGLQLATLAALFRCGCFWGMIGHDIGSMKAGVRAGDCYKQSPGISTWFTPSIIPELGGIR